jgi:hypothetical protein
VDEIGFVSGGEAPCITLQTECVGPPPIAAGLSNVLEGAVAVAGVIAVETGTKLAARWTAVLVVAAWTMDQFSSGGGNQGDGGGGGDADKKKEKEEQKLDK